MGTWSRHFETTPPASFRIQITCFITCFVFFSFYVFYSFLYLFELLKCAYLKALSTLFLHLSLCGTFPLSAVFACSDHLVCELMYRKCFAVFFLLLHMLSPLCLWGPALTHGRSVARSTTLSYPSSFLKNPEVKRVTNLATHILKTILLLISKCEL